MTDISNESAGAEIIPIAGVAPGSLGAAPPAAGPPPANQKPPRLTRKRRDGLERMSIEDKVKIVDRVLQFYERDLRLRQTDMDARLQRQAKLRMWTEGRDFPWPDASDVALPDIMTASLRLQDTLSNAVMQQRPAVVLPKATVKHDAEKEDIVRDLIDYQMFVEQDGEEIVSALGQNFTDDGVYIAYVPWVRERREIYDVLTFPPIPTEGLPVEYFQELISTTYPRALPLIIGEGDTFGWDWEIDPNDGGEKFTAKFYTKKDGVELVSEREIVVYDGPRILVLDFEDVIVPPRVANLQTPGPSNPHGAGHVILRDYPSVDEVKRLARQGIYSLTKDQISEIETRADNQVGQTDRPLREQADTFAGMDNDSGPDVARSQRKLTRLTCFDTKDIDDDGGDEDVVWSVLVETKTYLRGKRLTELFPSTRPQRPLVTRALLPVSGNWTGLSIPELLEGIHDAVKELMDQTIDFGTIQSAPFGFYRASSTLKPEPISISPGELYPLSDPQRDINIPEFGSRDQTFGFNMITVLSQEAEKLTLIGDIQLGRVPAGRSSALRTVGGIALLSGQGEARPERILRRFFTGLASIGKQMHELNQHFLPADKQIRVSGKARPGQDPYKTIGKRDEVAGAFDFEFTANVLNTSRQALQENLEALLSLYVNEFTIGAGIASGDGVYRLLRDIGIARGQNPDKYIDEPAPGARTGKIFSEDALTIIINGGVPAGQAAEAGGAAEHLEKLKVFMQGDDFGLLGPEQQQVFKVYIQQVAQQAQFEQEQEQQKQQAGAFNQQTQQAGPSGQAGEAAPPDLSNPPIQGAELFNETLPGAGGGGAQF